MHSRGNSSRELDAQVICAPGNYGFRASLVPISVDNIDASPTLPSIWSISPSLVRSSRSGLASSIGFDPAAFASLVPPVPQPSSSAAKRSRRIHGARYGSPLRATASAAPGRSASGRFVGGAGNSCRRQSRWTGSGQGCCRCADRRSTLDAIRLMMDERQFGDAGSRIVLEQCLVGRGIVHASAIARARCR